MPLRPKPSPVHTPGPTEIQKSWTLLELESQQVPHQDQQYCSLSGSPFVSANPGISVSLIHKQLTTPCLVLANGLLGEVTQVTSGLRQ